MGFISAKLDDVEEGTIVPEGTYPLQIVKVEDRDSKRGNPITIVTIRILDASIQNPLPITHVINHVTPGLPEDQRRMRLLEVKRFLSLFNVSYTDEGYNTEDLQGQEAECFILQEEGDDKVIRNKMRLPRLKA